jgi:hypothetical protein
MNGRQFLELLARLPARVWLQAILGLIGFVVLAVLGFALIAGVAAVIVLLILGFKAKAWVRALFTGQPPAPRNAPKVIDVPYEIVEHRDNGGRDDERR